MANKVKRKPEVYRSFEQLKTELFPLMSAEERRRSSKWTPIQMGACMADDAIEELLRAERKKSPRTHTTA